MIVVGFFFLFFFKVLAASIYWCYLLNSEVLVSPRSLIFAIAWYIFFVELTNTFLNLITRFLPLQVIYSRNIDFHQTLIKRILVNLVNTLAILSMVKWFKTPTFNFIYFITFLCGSSGLGYFTCFHALYLNFFPFVF